MRLDDLPVLSAVAVLFLVVALGAVGLPSPDGRRAVWWKRDAFFWFGLLFLLYAGVQWWNAGRDIRFDSDAQRWFYTAPHNVFLPWAFTRPEAAQMLHWFFPAWAIGLFVRSPIISRRGAALLARGLLYGAALLVVCGAAQRVFVSSRLFWRMPPDAVCFASFPYANHAAAYFLLLGAVAAGLFYREIFRRDRPPQAALSWRLALAMFLCLTGANLSLSRAGIILAWVLAAFVAGYGLLWGWRLLRPVAKVRLAAATVAVLTVFCFLVTGLAGSDIRQEFAVQHRPLHPLLPSLTAMNLDLSDRPRLIQAAWSVFLENPWYGVGGWGFRYLVPFHMPREMWGYLQNNPGRANVHCDALQFLVEFGLIGFGLLMAVLGAMVLPLFRRGINRGAVFTMTCAGLGLVLVFGLIDLPFRCPALLWTWTALFAALPKLTAREAVGVTAIRGVPPILATTP